MMTRQGKWWVVGGIVAGKSVIIEWLRQRGRPFLFSSAVTVPDAGVPVVNTPSETKYLPDLSAGLDAGVMVMISFPVGPSESKSATP